MRIAILQTGNIPEPLCGHMASFSALFEAALRHRNAQLHFVVDTINITHNHLDDALLDVTPYSGFIMTGSPAFVGDNAPWMLYGQKLIRHIVEKNIPFLGVCFGHQMIGAAFDADVGPNPHGMEMGTVSLQLHHDDKFRNDPLFGHLPSSFDVQVTHRDAVRIPSAALDVYAKAPHDNHHLIRVHVDGVAKAAWGVQFHPEFDEEVMKMYVEIRRPILESYHGVGAAETRLANIKPTPLARSILTQFARLCAAHRLSANQNQR